MKRYIYPDGTESTFQPGDGQIFHLWSKNQVNLTIYQYDGFMDQWVDITGSSSLASSFHEEEVCMGVCDCGSKQPHGKGHSQWCKIYES